MFQKNSMYIIYSETDHQPRLYAWDKCWGLVHWEDPEESGGEGRGRGGSGWGIHVTPWLIHVNVWQNPLKCYEVISPQLIKINEKKNMMLTIGCCKYSLIWVSSVLTLFCEEFTLVFSKNKSFVSLLFFIGVYLINFHVDFYYFLFWLIWIFF